MPCSQPKKFDTRKDLRVAIQKRVAIRAASSSNTNPNPGLGYHLVESCVIEDVHDRATRFGWYRLDRRQSLCVCIYRECRAGTCSLLVSSCYEMLHRRRLERDCRSTLSHKSRTAKYVSGQLLGPQCCMGALVQRVPLIVMNEGYLHAFMLQYVAGLQAGLVSTRVRLNNADCKPSRSSAMRIVASMNA